MGAPRVESAESMITVMRLLSYVDNRTGDDLIIVLAGEATVATRGKLRDVLCMAVADRAGHLRVDLGGLTSIDCTCISTLLAVARIARVHGSGLTVARPHGYVRRARAVTGALDLLTRPGQPGRPPPAGPSVGLTGQKWSGA